MAANNNRFRIHQSVPDGHHLQIDQAKGPDGRPIPNDLVSGTGTLERQQFSTDAQQRNGPAGQPFQRRNSPRGHHIGATTFVDDVVGAASDDTAVRQVKIRDDLLQEYRSSLQWLDQDDLAIRPANGQRNTGQSGARSDVYDSLAGRQQFTGHGRIQDVPAPESGCLAGPDQTTTHAVAGQRLDVSSGDLDPLTEQAHGSRWLGLDIGRRCDRRARNRQ
nr:hypothetical protein [Nakamurella panacisegetis]